MQLALTPVFLLSGVGALLNVFANRLGRVADQADALAIRPYGEAGREQRLRRLTRRSQALDFAVVLAALAGGLTCATVLVLFLGVLLGTAAAGLLFALFGGALLLTMGSITAFVVEMMLAARGVRIVVDRSADAPAPLAPGPVS